MFPVAWSYLTLAQSSNGCLNKLLQSQTAFSYDDRLHGGHYPHTNLSPPMKTPAEVFGKCILRPIIDNVYRLSHWSWEVLSCGFNRVDAWFISSFSWPPHVEAATLRIDSELTETDKIILKKVIQAFNKSEYQKTINLLKPFLQRVQKKGNKYLEVRLRNLMGTAYHELQQSSKALNQFKKNVEVLKSIPEEIKVLTSIAFTTYHLLSREYFFNREHLDALSYCDQAQKHARTDIQSITINLLKVDVLIELNHILPALGLLEAQMKKVAAHLTPYTDRSEIFDYIDLHNQIIEKKSNIPSISLFKNSTNVSA